MTTADTLDLVVEKLTRFDVSRLTSGDRRAFRQSLQNLSDYLDRMQSRRQFPRKTQMTTAASNAAGRLLSDSDDSD